MSSIKNSRAAAEEARKRAAEEARKKAAEEARKKAAQEAAKKLTEAAQRQAAARDAAKTLTRKAGDKPGASAIRQAFGMDELSRGVGRALRERASSGLGTPPPSAPTAAKAMRLSELLSTRGQASASAVTGGQQASTDAAQVQRTWDDAIRAGKSEPEAAHAAAKELERLARASSDPQYVQKLTELAGPTIDRIATVAGQAARNDLQRDQNLLKDTMKRLATVADLGGGAEIAHALAEHLPDDTELEEVDDALFEHMESGGSSSLARLLHDELRGAGKLEAAKGLADNEHGTDLELVVIREARGALDAGASPQEVANRYGEYLTAHVAEAVSTGHNEDSVEAMKLLADLSDLGGPAVATQLGKQLAAQVPNQSDLHKLDDVLHDLAKQGKGLGLTTALIGELSRLGKTDALRELSDVAQVAIEKTLETYGKAQSEWAAREAALGQDLAMYGPGLTDTQRQAYVDAFWADPANKAVKDAYGVAERELSAQMTTLGPALEAEALAGDAKAGQVLLDGMKALAASPNGGGQALDFVERLGKSENKALFDALNTDGKLEDTLSDDVLAPAVGSAQSKAMADGSMDELVAQLKRLQTTGKNFAKIPGALSGAIQTYEKIGEMIAAGKSGQEIMAAIRFDRITDGWDSKGKLGKAMAVFTVVSSMVKAGQTEGGLEKLQASLSAVKGGLELTAGILGTLGRAGKLAGGEAAGKLIGRFLPFVSFAIDGLQLKEDINNLMNGGNAGDAIAALGTVINLVGDVAGVVPIAGTAVDGILTAVGSIVQGLGGLIGSIIDGNEAAEKRREDHERFLTAAGVSPEVRALLLEGGLVDLSALGTMGLSRDQFLAVLRGQRSLPTDDQGKSAYALRMSWSLAALYGMEGAEAVRFTTEMQEKINDMSWEDLGRLDNTLNTVASLAAGASIDGRSPEEVREALKDSLSTVDAVFQQVAGDVFEEWDLEGKSEQDVNVPFFSTWDQR